MGALDESLLELLRGVVEELLAGSDELLELKGVTEELLELYGVFEEDEILMGYFHRRLLGNAQAIWYCTCATQSE